MQYALFANTIAMMASKRLVTASKCRFSFSGLTKFDTTPAGGCSSGILAHYSGVSIERREDIFAIDYLKLQ